MATNPNNKAFWAMARTLFGLSAIVYLFALGTVISRGDTFGQIVLLSAAAITAGTVVYVIKKT